MTLLIHEYHIVEYHNIGHKSIYPLSKRYQKVFIFCVDKNKLRILIEIEEK